MKARFDDKRRLISALQTQKICAGDAALANALTSEVEIKELNAGDILISEDGSDNDMYFVLSGILAILVKGRKVAERAVNDHVGEMSAIAPSLPRSATVIAETQCVVGKISEEKLSSLAMTYPNVWRNLAEELAKRLFQRNSLISQPNMQPRLFVISSKESLNIAQEIQSILSHDMLVDVWTDGVFFASGYALEALERAVDNSDFGLAIAEPDDVVVSRGLTQPVARDNVIFELGLFMGNLGRRRTILFQPEGKPLKLPSDLNGLTAISYRSGKSVTSLLAPACHEVRKLVKELGVK